MDTDRFISIVIARIHLEVLLAVVGAAARLASLADAIAAAVF